MRHSDNYENEKTLKQKINFHNTDKLSFQSQINNYIDIFKRIKLETFLNYVESSVIINHKQDIKFFSNGIKQNRLL